MRLLTRAFGLYYAALLVQAELQADLNPYDALPSGVSLIPYDSVPHTVLDSQAAVDAYLKEWTAANDRTPASAEQRCPPSCTKSGSDPKNWHLYSDVAQLQLCNETLVFDFAVDQELDNKHTKGMFRACMADYGSSSGTKRASSSRAACSVVNPSKVKVNVEIGWAGSAGSSDGSKAAVIAASQISQHIKSRKSICANNTVSFSSSGRTLVGLYAGSQVVSQGVAESVIDEFTSHAEKNGLSDKTVFQLCQSKDRGADFAIGIVISLSGDVSFIQSTVKAWNNGACAPDIEGTKKWADFTLQVPTIVTSSNTTSVRGLARRAPPPANSDGTCTTKRVDGGDSCAALAAKCGISPADFTKINSDKDFCTSLVPGQYVCCSRGTLPDLTPKPEKDGSCAVYNIKDNDSCSSVAAAYGLTVDKLETFNKNTWGWNGCKVLWSGINICLSEGIAPMPAPVSNAVCGPTVPGTKKPTTGKNITELNPCPLKVCCNIWGQCGISSDFCVVTKSATGAPGTAKPGTNGCIQNCGSDIIESGPPKETMRIGYFGSWNGNRECLNMHADEIDVKAYTHIHFAFANVTSDFNVEISGVTDEFERFKKLTGVKKIISFGGWDFSTNPGTFRIIREAVKPANRNKFRDNIVKFVNDNGLDGFDLDWEYPGASDIPGVPPSGDPQEGLNYYKFLSIMKPALGSGKSVSFAAPASYWYLKAFPIELMAKSLDYIVYMTYDLHGQWDYGNKWASPGCPDGNCLRSHVNLTETILSLSMITKAGVPSNKVAVGITSYGRSFHMAEAGCDGPECKFTGSFTRSDAMVGMCTDTSGYIADAEINDIIIHSPDNIKQRIDANSNILIYNDVEWVSYMDSDIKAYRKKVYDTFHFAGTSDWALDLQEFQDLKDVIPYEPPRELGICNMAYDTVQAIKDDQENIPWNCKHQYVLSALRKQLTAAIKQYNDIINDGYSHKYETFAKASKQSFEKALTKFYDEETDDYFDCVQSVSDDKSGIKSCNFHNVSIACPPKNSNDQAFNIYLTPKDNEKILTHLEKEYGVSPDAVYAEDLHVAPCFPEQDKICSCSKWGHLIGRKAVKPDWKLPDPKKYVQQALENVAKINDFLEDSTKDMKRGIFIHSASDTIDATAMPVLMIMAAVDSMDQIKEAGEKIEDEKRKNIILLALTAVFFVIPGLGGAIGTISGIAAIGRLATIVAEIGGAGLGVYSIVNDPKSAPLEIFGILMGGLAVKSAAKGWVGDAASVRRTMTAAHVRGMGRIVSEGLDNIDTVIKACKRT